METARFANRDGKQHILDLVALCAFRSAASISFDLGHYVDTLVLPGGDLIEGDVEIDCRPGGVFRWEGRVDIHHPCEEHIQTQIIAILPTEYHTYERAHEFIMALFEALDIPTDETFGAWVLGPGSSGIQLENVTDRDGISYWT